MNFELGPIDEGLRKALEDASRRADAVGQIAATIVSAGSASVLMSAGPDSVRLAISRVTVLIGDEPGTMQRFVRAVAQPLSQTTVAELNADELPRRVLVDVDVLDANDLTIATGAVEWIVEISGRSSSGSR
jgi:hypothetical protein